MTRFFVPKAWLGGVGTAVGLAGMVTEHRVLVWIAIACLSAAVLLRLLERRMSEP